jgi:hypothetical protein
LRPQQQPAVRCLGVLVRAAERHGDVQVTIRVEGARVEISPVDEQTAPIVLGEDQKDLGASVAVLLVRTLGGEVALADGTLAVTLPS